MSEVLVVYGAAVNSVWDCDDSLKKSPHLAREYIE